MMNRGTREVASYAEASRVVREEIDATGVGGTEWASHCAGLIRVDGKVVAHVSYNGKVWPGRKWKPGVAPIVG